MHPLRRALLAIHLVGGLAVLGSYAHGFATWPELAPSLWGGVPDWLRPFYTASMLLAAAGYFAMSLPIAFRLDPERTRVGASGFGLFPWLYALILLPSALWMPLTFELLQRPRPGLWLAIRLVLLLVGAGSLLLCVAIARARPWPSRRLQRLALAGGLAFSLQTALLDALLWPALFPAPR
jgi:hypothetical protein